MVRNSTGSEAELFTFVGRIYAVHFGHNDISHKNVRSERSTLNVGCLVLAVCRVGGRKARPPGAVGAGLGEFLVVLERGFI